MDRANLKFTDLHQLYVKDGLVSLFTTFGDYADSVDLAAGTWTDIVAGEKGSTNILYLVLTIVGLSIVVYALAQDSLNKAIANNK